MMRLSKTIAYAVSAMLDLTIAEPGVPISSSELARLGKMSERFLLQILRRLVTHGLLRSTRGVVGGYRLSRSAGKITLGDIVEAVEGPREHSLAALGILKSGARKRILSVFDRAIRASRHELQNVTVVDLLRGTRKKARRPARAPHKRSAHRSVAKPIRRH